MHTVGAFRGRGLREHLARRFAPVAHAVVPAGEARFPDARILRRQARALPAAVPPVPGHQRAVLPGRGVAGGPGSIVDDKRPRDDGCRRNEGIGGAVSRTDAAPVREALRKAADEIAARKGGAAGSATRSRRAWKRPRDAERDDRVLRRVQGGRSARQPELRHSLQAACAKDRRGSRRRAGVGRSWRTTSRAPCSCSCRCSRWS